MDEFKPGEIVLVLDVRGVILGQAVVVRKNPATSHRAIDMTGYTIRYKKAGKMHTAKSVHGSYLRRES